METDAPCDVEPLQCNCHCQGLRGRLPLLRVGQYEIIVICVCFPIMWFARLALVPSQLTQMRCSFQPQSDRFAQASHIAYGHRVAATHSQIRPICIHSRMISPFNRCRQRTRQRACKQLGFACRCIVRSIAGHSMQHFPNKHRRAAFIQVA